MLKIPTIFLGLCIFHFCLAIDYSRERQEREQQRMRFQAMAPRRVSLVTVDAAFTVTFGAYIFLYLFIEDRVQVLRNGGFISEISRSRYNLPDNMHLQAAFLSPENDDKRIFYGDKYGEFYTDDRSANRRFKYGRSRRFIRDGGPDAAGRKSGKVYVFKGCQVAVRNDWNDWGKPVNVTTMGLPCDIHAAWNERDAMVILKGDKIWRWNADDTVTGPQPFESTYTILEDYALMPLSEERQPQ